jgi:prolyl oligopeptidase PreP (S9A serine peptidase family)
MQRYHKLLAGASWMAEYGNPDTEDWNLFLKGYSPYHNIDPNANYPPILVTTSTRDDRVHPGHARKFVKVCSCNPKVLKTITVMEFSSNSYLSNLFVFEST